MSFIGSGIIENAKPLQAPVSIANITFNNNHHCELSQGKLGD
jgi:hypothetical protein